ncbi:MAG: hypothetical protein ABFS42_06550 [Candidatus Krumholzibacteriota bacterium]
MQPGYKSSPKAHVVRIVLTLAVIVTASVVLRQVFLPDEFGKHGHYRPGAVEDEANRETRIRTNESCFDCHPLIKEIHVDGVHKTVMCEVCHGAYADHVKDDQVIGAMPVASGGDIKPLCVKCHNKIVQAMPPETIKLVAMPEHLEERKFRTHHICDQCHHVHAPLKWVHEAREMMGLPLERKRS